MSSLRDKLRFGKLPSKTLVTLTTTPKAYHLQSDFSNFYCFFFLYVIVFFPLDLSCPITSTSYRTINMTNILPVHHILQYSSTFFCTRQHLLGDHWLSVKLKRGKTDVYQERKHIKKMIKLIYRRQILCYNHKFDPQIWPSGIMLGLK